MIKKVDITELNLLKTDQSAPFAVYTENTKSDHMIIYFGSFNGEFRGNTTVSKLGCNGLFLRSNRATWYLEPLESLGETVIEVCDTINNFIKTKEHIKTVTLAGFSMGGWAALLYSTWIKCNKVVATAPQTIYPDFEIEGEIPKQPCGYWEAFDRIDKVWEVYGEPECEIIIQCCSTISPSEKWKDVKEVETLEKFDNVEIDRYPCKGHKGIGPLLLADVNKYEKTFLV